MSCTFRASTLPLVALLLVNVAIISGVVVRISHLYGVGVETYTYYDWILGIATIVLMCISALYAFIGYAVITGKKLYKQFITSAAILQIVSLIVATTITLDLLIFVGLASSIVTATMVIASLHLIMPTT
ncbi:MAG: hypothetical protein QW335_05690 [Candidatus Nezhaarchaeales archaeon]